MLISCDREVRRLGRVPQVGCRHHVDAATDAGALDRAQHGDPGPLQAAERILQLQCGAAEPFARDGSGAPTRDRRSDVSSTAEHRQVHARAEVFALARQHDRTDRTRRRHPVDDRRADRRQNEATIEFAFSGRIIRMWPTLSFTSTSKHSYPMSRAWQRASAAVQPGVEPTQEVGPAVDAVGPSSADSASWSTETIVPRSDAAKPMMTGRGGRSS